MRHRSLSILIFGFLVGLFANGTAVKAEDPNSGIWKMNPAKSKYDPGPAPKSSTTTKTDGNDYPLSGTPNADKVSVKRVDANTIETTRKKDGKTVMKTHAMVSSNGKTRTVTFDGTDPQGHKVHNVVVFEKGM